MRFKALDGWRGLCALMVALFHLPALTHFGASPLVFHGYLYVDFFFVLSGYIIAFSYGEKLAVGGVGETRRFLIRRFGRLWPLHAATLGVLVAWEAVKAVAAPGAGEVAPFTHGRGLVEILTNLLMVQGLGVHGSLTWNAPAWSISVEFAAYILFALVSLVAPRRVTLVAAAFVVAGLDVVGVQVGHMDTTFDFGLFRALAGFFLGVLVRKAPPARLSGGAAATAETAVFAGVLAFVALATGLAQLAAPFVFAVAVWVFAAEGGPVSAALKTAPLQALGTWSYSVYLVHYPVTVGVGVARKLAERVLHVDVSAPVATASGPLQVLSFRPMIVTDLAAVAYLAVVIGLAALTYRFIETPGRNLFNRLAARDAARNSPRATEPARAIEAEP